MSAVTEIALPYFLARPASRRTATAGVVVIHEGPGISPQLLRFCQRLAGEGYAAVAPDLFFRAGGTQAADYAALMGSLVPDLVRSDLGAAAAVTRDVGAVKVGVTGFCMGGLLTYRAALAGGFDAAAGFYGARIAQELGSPTCPTLLLFGDDDPYIPVEDIDTIRAHHPETVVYAGATHGFMRDGSESFHPDAAEDAWARLLAFFGEHLR